MVGREFKHVMPALAAAIIVLTGGTSAQALSMKECSVKYKAAQADGTAGDTSWSEFRKQQCSHAADEASGEAPSELKMSEKKSGGADADGVKDAVDAKTEHKSDFAKMTFPSSISQKFAGEKPAKARMHTCVEQYHVNKDANTLGGMRWIEKGGGYYKLCNAKLKGKE